MSVALSFEDIFTYLTVVVMIYQCIYTLSVSYPQLVCCTLLMLLSSSMTHLWWAYLQNIQALLDRQLQLQPQGLSYTLTK